MEIDALWTWVAIIGISLVFSALFSGSEIAYISSDRVRVELDIKKGGLINKIISLYYSHQDMFISTILVGNNIVNILCSSLTTALFLEVLGEGGVAIATLVTTVVVLIFGEVTPKSIAKENAENFAMAISGSISFFMIIFTPLNYFFSFFKKYEKNTPNFAVLC